MSPADQWIVDTFPLVWRQVAALVLGVLGCAGVPIMWRWMR